MRSIVFSTVSHLDMYTGEDRKDRWRPLLELLRIHDFKVDRLYFFISHLYRHIVPTLVKDMNNAQSFSAPYNHCPNKLAGYSR